MSDRFVAGIDLGGTKILSVLLDRSFAIVAEDLRQTEAQDGPNAVISRMLDSLRASAGENPLRAIGISTAGPVDINRGLVTTPPNLPGWHDVPLGERISVALGVPAWLENDANAAAVAEHRLGAGRGCRHMVLVAVGTGIGGGLILDGRLYHGASGGAGEIGHMLVEPQGRVCGCGRRGCLEAMASGSALDAVAREIAQAQPHGSVAEMARNQGMTPDARILDAAALAGDAAAASALERAGAYLGDGLTNLVDVFNPEVIVIGGSVRRSRRYLETAVAVMQRDAYPQHLVDVRIAEAELGDEAPAIGAALLAIDQAAAIQ
jgi:glucokinase